MLERFRRDPLISPNDISGALQAKPSLLTIPPSNAYPYRSEPNGPEAKPFYFSNSNEYFTELPKILGRLGGVGVAVGADQGFDFFTFARLKGAYLVDIDEYTSLTSRSYVEVGARLHQLLGRYPTVGEFIPMFASGSADVKLNLLAASSSRYTFSENELSTIKTHSALPNDKYLLEKYDIYAKSSWIGSDRNLRNLITAYEEGKIRICRGSIAGNVVPAIAAEIAQQKETVSLIYLSNALDGTTTSSPSQDLNWIKTQLPITDRTKFVFSAKPGAGLHFHRAPLPWQKTGDFYAHRWTFFVTNPTITTPPHPHMRLYEREDYKEVKPGYYVMK